MINKVVKKYYNAKNPAKKSTGFFVLVPEAGVEPARCRHHRILSYLLHTEYKRTQPRMEVIDGHQSACNYWLF